MYNMVDDIIISKHNYVSINNEMYVQYQISFYFFKNSDIERNIFRA